MPSIYDDLTPDWLKNTYLGGVDLTLDDGSPFDERIYTESIRSAVEYVEKELGLKIDKLKVYREKHDAINQDREAFWPFRLDYRPVQSVTKIRLTYGNTTPVDLPADWVNLLSELHGQVHLIPTTASPGTFQFVSGIPLFSGHLASSHIPGLFEIDYVAGFVVRTGSIVVPQGSAGPITVSLPAPAIRVPDYSVTFTLSNPAAGDAGIKCTLDDRDEAAFTFNLSAAPTAAQGLTVQWKLTTVPYDLRQAIGLRASMLALDVAGDLIAGAGVANSSISMDGLSESVGTTSSATNSGYGSRVLQFERELKLILPALRSKYKAPGFFAF